MRYGTIGSEACREHGVGAGVEDDAAAKGDHRVPAEVRHASDGGGDPASRQSAISNDVASDGLQYAQLVEGRRTDPGSLRIEPGPFRSEHLAASSFRL